MKVKILFALSALLMLGSVSLNAQEVGNSSNSESTTQLEGDLNHDNKVDVADVTYLVNIIMNQSTSEDIPVTSVSVSPTSATISVNGTQQLSATVSPSNATNKSVTWSSSNTSVATVSSSGLVTGVSAGTATITVTTSDGNKKGTATLTVLPRQVTNYYWYVGNTKPTSNTNPANDLAQSGGIGWTQIDSKPNQIKIFVQEPNWNEVQWYLAAPAEWGFVTNVYGTQVRGWDISTVTINGIEYTVWTAQGLQDSVNVTLSNI
jgi:hypothetical protein